MQERGLPSREAVSSVLSFYGSQLTSHASMIVGFIVAFFTLMQARESIVAVSGQGLFQFGALTIVSAVAYSMFRVVLYGSLSGVLMNGGVDEYRAFVGRENVELFEHALVNKFAASQLVNYTTVRSVLYKRRGRDSRRAGGYVTFWVQPPMIVSAAVAILVVGVIFGWSAVTLAEAFGSLVLGVSLVAVLSLRFAVARASVTTEVG